MAVVPIIPAVEVGPLELILRADGPLSEGQESPLSYGQIGWLRAERRAAKFSRGWIAEQAARPSPAIFATCRGRAFPKDSARTLGSRIQGCVTEPSQNADVPSGSNSPSRLPARPATSR